MNDSNEGAGTDDDVDVDVDEDEDNNDDDDEDVGMGCCIRCSRSSSLAWALVNSRRALISMAMS